MLSLLKNVFKKFKKIWIKDKELGGKCCNTEDKKITNMS